MARFGTVIDEPQRFGTVVEETQQFGRVIEEETPMPTSDSLQERYGLSDDEISLIEEDWKSAYNGAKEKDWSNLDRAWMNARQSFFSNTLAGLDVKSSERGRGIQNQIYQNRQLLQSAAVYVGSNSDRYKKLEQEINEENSRLNRELKAKRIEGLRQQARRAGEYAGMPDYDGPVEGFFSLVGQLAGGSLTPETLFPAAKGKTVLGMLAKEGRNNAIINAASNPFVQAGNIASGDQEKASKGQFFADVGVGVVAPGLFKAPGMLRKFLKSRGQSGVRAQLAEEGAKFAKTATGDDLIDDIGYKSLLDTEDLVARKKGRRAGIDPFIAPISSRLDRILPGLGKMFNRHAYHFGILTSQGHKNVEPFLKQLKRMRKSSKSDYDDFDLALKNSDSQQISHFLDKYHMRDSYEVVRGTLDELHMKAKQAGHEVGYLDDYFPRRIKDYHGLKNYIDGLDENLRNPINDALDIEAKKLGLDDAKSLEPEMRAELITKVLRGMGPTGARVNLGPTGNFKNRAIEKVTRDIQRYYHNSPDALLQYIDNVSRIVADSAFFGKGRAGDNQFVDASLNPEVAAKDWTNENIGEFLNAFNRAKILKSEEVEQLKKITHAYFGSHGAQSNFIKGFRGFTHMTTIGNPISTLTQFRDLTFNMYKNGFFNGVMGLKDAIVRGPNIIRKEDIGVTDIAADYADFGKLAKATDKLFKVTGFSAVDRLGKEAFINARFRALQKRAQAPKGSKAHKKLVKELTPALKQDVDDTIAALARGDKSDANVRFALMDSLSEFQPITRAQMPEFYLKSPNGRIFYTLKTFALRQFDMMRSEIYDEMRKGNVAKGLGRLLHLGTWYLGMGMGVDSVKDWMLGREVTMSDRVAENMLQTMGITRWHIYQGKRDLPYAATSIVSPPTSIVKDMSKDIINMSRGEFELKYAETLKNIPVLGKIYHWRLGAGRKREDEKRPKF